MRKLVLSLGLLLLSGGVLMAQDKKKSKKKDKEKVATTVAAPESSTISFNPATPSLPAQPASVNPDDMVFNEMSHDFGSIPEGPDAAFDFVFTNSGKEPIIVQKAQPSCGCTVPSFSSEPVLPGKTGSIKVAYHTQGRPNAFTKTISVVSNAGTKVLTIKGNVEKAPTSSVPENNSMIKTN